MADLKVNIAGVEWKNPVTTASGTFGFGREYSEYFDLSGLGAICLKALSAVERRGNESPRIAETNQGILNSVGLQNPGAEHFIEYVLPWLRNYDTKLIANLAGSTIEDYVEVTQILGDKVDMLELNISCPNVKEGGMAFGTDAKMVEKVTKSVKKAAKVPLIVKLSPNVTDHSRDGSRRGGGRSRRGIAYKYAFRNEDRYKYQKASAEKQYGRAVGSGGNADSGQDGVSGQTGGQASHNRYGRNNHGRRRDRIFPSRAPTP